MTEFRIYLVSNRLSGESFPLVISGSLEEAKTYISRREGVPTSWLCAAPAEIDLDVTQEFTYPPEVLAKLREIA